MSFSGPLNRERNGGNETISGELKQLKAIEVFFQFLLLKGNIWKKLRILGTLLVSKVSKRKQLM